MSTPGPASVLLVAADAAERGGLARVLADGGLAVTEAASADEALRRAADQPPHLVLLHTSQSDLPPTEVCRRLRADPATAAVPVLLLSGEAPDNGRALTPTPPAELLGRVEGLIRLHRAEGERRRLEEPFLQAQKLEAVGRLAGGIAHDFNNLLTVINGYAAMLLEDLGAETDSAAHARAILTAGERAAVLTQQLLAFGRKQIVAPRLLDLSAVVAGAADGLRRLLGADVLLDLDLRPGLGRVRADAAQLQQVLLNLALNAREAMPRGGRLSLATREAAGEGGADGPRVLLTVADTGHGMSDEVRRHLFEPFFTTKDPGQGPGLGLACVYGIIRQAGGHIEVETAPGVGTTFRISLPRAADPEPAAPPAEAAPAPPAQATVLLAEDDDGVRALARHVLAGAGCTVLEAADGGEALRVAGRHAGRIDLLVSDLTMPGLGGRELAERLRAREPALKVLYLSGHTEDELVRQGVSRQEMHFLHKPFSPPALAQKVRQILGAGR
jgi:signal transduction histidine kinase